MGTEQARRTAAEQECFDIDEQGVRMLLREQHPDLAGLPLERAATGWSNETWRLGGDLAVRLPRRAPVAADLRKEHRWLPALAPRLPLPVPTPSRLGEPAAHFGWPWLVTTWVPGEPGDRAAITCGAAAADELARFLLALHVQAPPGAPAAGPRGVELRALTRDFDERLADAAPADSAGLRAVWDAAVSAPGWNGSPVWLHGDLHPANVLVRRGRLAGVIDFGELGAGDPAVDLAAAWLVLPAGAVGRFLDGYAADDETVRRARGWAVHIGLGLMGVGKAWDRGLPGGQPTWGRAGRKALDLVLASG
jgi:aminoglycoside phosphotransferase (APT) family kinase protein